MNEVFLLGQVIRTEKVEDDFDCTLLHIEVKNDFGGGSQIVPIYCYSALSNYVENHLHLLDGVLVKARVIVKTVVKDEQVRLHAMKITFSDK